MAAREKNWTGKEIGPFIVLCKTEKKDKRGSFIWKVKCSLCGRIKERNVNKKELSKFESCKGCLYNRKTEMEKMIKIPRWYLTTIKRSASKRNIEFLVSDKYLFTLFKNQNAKCALSGISIEFGKNIKNKSASRNSTASLDRINNSNGYVEGNVQWVHKDVNFMKQDYDESTFLNFCYKISTHKNHHNLSNNNTRILIPGGGGFIGNILTPFLLENGYTVTILDNLIHRNQAILQNCNHERFNFIYGDVRNRDLYREYISKNDIIINLAAYVGAPLCNRFPIETNQVNLESAIFLSNVSSKNQKIIFTNTNSGYGTGQHKDDKPIYCTEESPLNPISLYATTKVAAENTLMSKGNCTSLRLATVMGLSPKLRMDLLVNDFTYRAWNDRFIVLFESHFFRNFIHIKDVTRAIYHAINLDKTTGQVYNCGNSSVNINKMELCLFIKKYVTNLYIKESLLNKDPDKRNYIVSNKKLENTGWLPSFSLDYTIQEVLKACPIIKYSNYNFTDL